MDPTTLDQRSVGHLAVIDPATRDLLVKSRIEIQATVFRGLPDRPLGIATIDPASQMSDDLLGGHQRVPGETAADWNFFPGILIDFQRASQRSTVDANS